MTITLIFNSCALEPSAALGNSLSFDHDLFTGSSGRGSQSIA
ncbi:hypothetical protein P4N68_00700 [Corynebacterium felinum]|uniref:Uncharacterized protein n=1 Tax=Corynebacterium felinum TaxID=131318 RepID=A0ABU2BA58_9CORY|nr:hypothetical protein [Corynebacterium felinum]MDF5819598.1 hypothetical protein [Corynebacterium felinum]MDR7354274.1 hypothetical protein [Corynebacterium felinum]